LRGQFADARVNLFSAKQSRQRGVVKARLRSRLRRVT
jgi:hypothetical protein